MRVLRAELKTFLLLGHFWVFSKVPTSYALVLTTGINLSLLLDGRFHVTLAACRHATMACITMNENNLLLLVDFDRYFFSTTMRKVTKVCAESLPLDICPGMIAEPNSNCIFKDLFILFYVYECFVYLYVSAPHACLLPSEIIREG